jgi:uncharacterized protein YfaT (DUF1175 family)
MPLSDQGYGSVSDAAKYINTEIANKIKPRMAYAIRSEFSGYGFLNSSLLYRMPFGACDDYNILTVLTMRSHGVPVMIDYIPQWGKATNGHSWCVALNNSGRDFAFDGATGDVPGTLFRPYGVFPKVFRKTYRINKKVAEYHAHAAYIDKSIELFSTDVTEQYAKCDDIAVKVNKRGVKDKYVYLGVFDHERWKVVDFGILKSNKALFSKVGRNMLYIVMGYDGDGLKYISDPFILDISGRIEVLSTDTVNTDTITITRKFPKSVNTAMMEHIMAGGKIQASNDVNFTRCETLHTIESVEMPDLITLNNAKKYRYWRYIGRQHSYGNIAELQFFTMGDIVHAMKGKAIGTRKIYRNSHRYDLSKAFDGDWLTHFRSDSLAESWVGLDFGEPVSIGYVRCVPRSDDNSIRNGDTYQLKYWDDGQWVPLGSSIIANDNRLIYRNVPSNTCFWISNLTRGKQEQVFTSEDGRQIFW